MSDELSDKCPRCGSKRVVQGTNGCIYDCGTSIYTHPNPHECEDMFTEACKIVCLKAILDRIETHCLRHNNSSVNPEYHRACSDVLRIMRGEK